MSTSLEGLAGRVALITGAGRNLGRQVALTLADAGANVAINVRQNEPEARAVAEAACQLGVQAVTAIGDVSDPDVDVAMVERVEDQLGPIEVLVHCVGIRPLRRVVETSIDEWHEVLETNCSSYFYLTRIMLPSMAERGFGRLIAVTGPDANRGHVGHGSVAASKAALAALTKVIAMEFGASGITANMVSPTITETTAVEHRDRQRLEQMLAIPRPGRLEEIAFACAYLASAQAAYITGQTFRVDGGFEM